MIYVSDLFCIYRGPERDVAALRGLTLEVGRGERVLIHGPSGSGKTTLMRVLAGTERPSAGRAIVDGVDLGGADRGVLANHTRRSLGMIDQRGGRNLRPELRCIDNVALQLGLLGTGGSERRRAAMALLDDLGLGHLAKRWPYELSGGEAQRVGVCAAVAHAPKLILADEPTGELDADSADDVYDLLAELAERRGATLLIVSHDPRAARIVERTVRIRDGRLSGERAPERWPDEALVVDERGWLRLPDDLRQQAGISGRATASIDGGGLRIDAVGGPGPGERPAPTAQDAALQPAWSPGEPVAILRGVRRAYGGRAVLDGLDLDLASGTLTILRGRSGSGKSTLLRILSGLDRPDDGAVEVAGRDLRTLDRSGLAAFRRDSVGVMLQQVALADALDASENLALSTALRHGRGQRVDEIRAALGLDVLRSRPARLLSGGERQRVAVARALIAETPLVLLDEPSSQLDEANARILGDLLRGEAERGRAVICATHDPVLVARGHVVVDLDQHSTRSNSRGTRDSTSMPSSVIRNVSM